MQDRKKDTDVYNGLLDSEGEGEGGMIWENGILACILSCKNWIVTFFKEKFFKESSDLQLKWEESIEIYHIPTASIHA